MKRQFERREEDTAQAPKYQYRVRRRDWYYDHTDSEGFDFFVPVPDPAEDAGTPDTVGHLFNTVEEALKVCSYLDIIEVLITWDMRRSLPTYRTSRVSLV